MQFGYPIRILLNHSCKTQIALFNKKLNISGFERLEILKIWNINGFKTAKKPLLFGYPRVISPQIKI